MSLGGGTTVTGINLSDAELAGIRTAADGTFTLGDSNQTGTITLTTATLATTAGAATVIVQSTSGAGKLVLDDGGTGPALNGNGGDSEPDGGGRVASRRPRRRMPSPRSPTPARSC